ncbi:hypothetical protein [Fervidicola ferrireducens]|nr:hypothetical protein [Fervidicola ferrireducens]
MEFTIFLYFLFAFISISSVLIQRGVPLLAAVGISVVGAVLFLFFTLAVFLILAGLLEISSLIERLIKRIYVKIERFEVALNPPKVPSAIAVLKVKFNNGVEINPRVYFHKKQRRYRCRLPVVEQRDERKVEAFEIYRGDILRRVIKLMSQQGNNET